MDPGMLEPQAAAMGFGYVMVGYLLQAMCAARAVLQLPYV